jgi:hypothetical protein
VVSVAPPEDDPVRPAKLALLAATGLGVDHVLTAGDGPEQVGAQDRGRGCGGVRRPGDREMAAKTDSAAAHCPRTCRACGCRRRCWEL